MYVRREFSALFTSACVLGHQKTLGRCHLFYQNLLTDPSLRSGEKPGSGQHLAGRWLSPWDLPPAARFARDDETPKMTETPEKKFLVDWGCQMVWGCPCGVACIHPDHLLLLVEVTGAPCHQPSTAVVTLGFLCLDTSYSFLVILACRF